MSQVEDWQRDNAALVADWAEQVDRELRVRADRPVFQEAMAATDAAVDPPLSTATLRRPSNRYRADAVASAAASPGHRVHRRGRRAPRPRERPSPQAQAGQAPARVAALRQRARGRHRALRHQDIVFDVHHSKRADRSGSCWTRRPAGAGDRGGRGAAGRSDAAHHGARLPHSRRRGRFH